MEKEVATRTTRGRSWVPRHMPSIPAWAQHMPGPFFEAALRNEQQEARRSEKKQSVVLTLA